MKQLSTLLISAIFIVCVYNNGFAQQIIESAAKAPTYNEYGDPLTNSIDPNGARQGVWSYTDYTGKEVVRETYKNHELIDSRFCTENKKKESEWISKSDMNFDKEFSDGVIKTTQSLMHNEGIQLDGVRQVLIVISTNKNVQIFLLGDWNASKAEAMKAKLETSIKKNLTTINGATYVLID